MPEQSGSETNGPPDARLAQWEVIPVQAGRSCQSLPLTESRCQLQIREPLHHLECKADAKQDEVGRKESFEANPKELAQERAASLQPAANTTPGGSVKLAGLRW